LASHYHFSMLAKNAKDMAAGAGFVGFLFSALLLDLAESQQPKLRIGHFPTIPLRP